METDWLRVKPVVKVIGEFWAQETEGDGNYQMFQFLEKEGAEVSVEPISNWVLYLLHQFKQRGVFRSRMLTHIAPWKNSPLAALKKRAAAWGKRSSFATGEGIYLGHYARLEKALLGEAHPLPSQAELAALADPYYNSELRGGEGHLEVAKNLYYTKHRLCHMVLDLKPFGCLPSLQSDAVQAGLAERFPEMVFLSVETSAEGEIHAYSRVQMALAEARVKAQDEFESTLRPRPSAAGQYPALRRPASRAAQPDVPGNAAPRRDLDRRQLCSRCGRSHEPLRRPGIDFLSRSTSRRIGRSTQYSPSGGLIMPDLPRIISSTTSSSSPPPLHGWMRILSSALQTRTALGGAAASERHSAKVSRGGLSAAARAAGRAR